MEIVSCYLAVDVRFHPSNRLFERGLETSCDKREFTIRANSGNRELVRVRVGVRILFLTYKNKFAYKFMINTVTFGEFAAT